MTNQLLLEKDKKVDRDGGGLVNFIEVCLCEV